MPRRVLMQRRRESFDLVEVPAPSEKNLQELMKRNPQLVPSDDLGLFGDLLVVGRETTLASGQIDLLCLARSGDLVLIEFKTGPQNPDFRSALAQLMDYGSDLWKLSRDEFDHGVVERYLRGAHCDEKFKAAIDLQAAISLTNWDLSTEDSAAMNSRLASVLATGDFTYVVAAQRFTPAMKTTLEYLNSTMRFGRFYLVELVRLEGEGLTAHAAQVVARPAVRGTSGPRGPGGQANLADFLNEISNDSYREAMRDVFSTVSTLGLTTHWGAKGASFRIDTTDRDEPLSIGWAFLPGDSFHGARHLTFGVDPASLKQTPTASPAVLKFIERIKAVDGSKPVPGLNGYTFEPDVVPSAKPAILEALDALVEDIQSQPEGASKAPDAG